MVLSSLAQMSLVVVRYGGEKFGKVCGTLLSRIVDNSIGVQ